MAQNCKRRILVAVDGSKAADHAFQWYLDHLRQPDDYVYGLIVPVYKFSGVSVFKKVGPLADVDALTSEFKSQHDIVEKVIADYTAKLRSAGVKGQFDEYCGESPETTILTQCEKLNCDSIVMGSRGLSGFKKFLLGSCSSYVLNHAPVPVSIIPLKQSDEEQQKKQ
ncbi:putative universal stress protein SAUSA300_1656 isoform X2 [Ruditapes philippinarum]|uniref:putative universal stress protein SAUSA300_1656 isoform X2 n=1 Tax=Ruditapes philippinarum TaxID=129788 RepID=UPI00295B5A36|nr:putative universal stress protein SAUSA300_1656 isoform X2 [Ruditapes philippinarum]